MKVRKVNRSLMLACCAVCGGLSGAIYMWSIFKIPLMQSTGLSSTTITFAYSLFEIMAMISGLLCSSVLKKVKVNTLVALSGAAFGLGWLLTGFADTAWKLYLTFSVIGGIGDGFIYNAIVSVVTRWYPDKRGFANGICLGAVGLAPLFFAPLGNMFIEHFDVFTSFMLCGAIFIVMRTCFGWFVKNPPEDYTAGDWNAGKSDSITSQRDIPTLQVLKMPLFFLIFFTFILADCSAIMLTAHVSAIGQEKCGLSAAQGASLVAIMAICSCAGRFGLGSISDKIGRYRTLAIATSLTALDMLFYMETANSFVSFMVGICIIGLCYGGVMSTIPALTADIFGNKYFSSNFACVFIGYTVACFVGPMLAAVISQNTGSYVPAFKVAGCLSIAALILVYAAAVANKKLIKNSAV